ncbi:MAG: hypothetical protein K0R54_69 [Clostridiaceae bacterium]|jgi:hypothetical protein|nr:hypothetical protein [Clostridiaceae bacterium]
MKNLIIKETVKLNYKSKEIYCEKYLLNNSIVNIKLIEKKENSYEELFTKNISDIDKKNLIELVFKNSITVANNDDIKALEEACASYRQNVITKLKNDYKNFEEVKLMGIGEIAGLTYIVLKRSNVVYHDIYLFEISDEGNKLEYNIVNAVCMELVLIDCIKYCKFNNSITYICFQDNVFAGIKQHKIDYNFLSVAILKKFNDNLNCKKAFLLEKSIKKEFEPLNESKFSKKLESELIKNSKHLTNKLSKELNYIM